MILTNYIYYGATILYLLKREAYQEKYLFDVINVLFLFFQIQSRYTQIRKNMEIYVKCVNNVYRVTADSHMANKSVNVLNKKFI